LLTRINQRISEARYSSIISPHYLMAERTFIKEGWEWKYPEIVSSLCRRFYWAETFRITRKSSTIISFTSFSCENSSAIYSKLHKISTMLNLKKVKKRY
jgi:predicted nucleotide-binding protein (sugar kinase/HSP70/actin superfamily)